MSAFSGRERLAWWYARLLRRARFGDVLYAASVLALALVAITSGRVASHALTPRSAVTTSRLLDDLEVPGVLPNALLARDDGGEVRLWDLTTRPRTLITMYAPWCEPCQQELPMLVQRTKGQPDLLAVVVLSSEDLADVRRKLDNLGLQALRFHVDSSRTFELGGRIRALPTTFLVGRRGRVAARVVGGSQFQLTALMSRLGIEGDVDSVSWPVR